MEIKAYFCLKKKICRYKHIDFISTMAVCLWPFQSQQCTPCSVISLLMVVEVLCGANREESGLLEGIQFSPGFKRNKLISKQGFTPVYPLRISEARCCPKPWSNQRRWESMVVTKSFRRICFNYYLKNIAMALRFWNTSSLFHLK